MKKSLISACGLLISAAAWASGVNVVFDGNDHNGWTLQGLVGIENGHEVAKMIDQGNGKVFRADLKYNSNNASEEYKITMNPATDKIMAIKFIGQRPQKNLKMEFNNGSTWFNKYNSPNGDITTSGGNHIYYFNLDSNADYAAATEEMSITLFNIIIADSPVEATYTIDWMRTFSSEDELKTNKDWTDDPSDWTTGVEAVFDGSMPQGWTVDGTSTFADGHLNVEMPDVSKDKDGTSFRADIKFAGDDNHKICFNPADEKILAIKFIGARPQGNLKMEFNDGQWLNSQWNGGWSDGSVETRSGNFIYYFDLTKDEKYTEGNHYVNKLNIIIADNKEEPHSYSVDWIRTFASLDDLKANRNWKDDGENDGDETVLAQPIENETTGESYATLVEAWLNAASEQVIAINKNQTVSERLNGDGRTITLRPYGDAENISIIRGESFNGIMFLTNAKSDDTRATSYATLNIENLTIDGANVEGTTPFEASQNGTLNLKNVTVNKVNSNNSRGMLTIKAGGHANLENVVFTNSTLVEGAPAVYYGMNCSLSLKGNIELGSPIEVEREGTIQASELTNTTPIAVKFDANRNLETNPVLISGWDKPENFSLLNEGYELKSDGEGNLKIVEHEEPVTPPVGAVENVEAASNAPVEYYNLQGVRVENPANGLYIRRQGANVTKVYVK